MVFPASRWVSTIFRVLPLVTLEFLGRVDKQNIVGLLALLPVDTTPFSAPSGTVPAMLSAPWKSLADRKDRRNDHVTEPLWIGI